MRIIFAYILLLSGVSAIAQKGELNSKVSGKKDGLWIVALDSHLCPTKKDTAFLAYEIYDRGKPVYKYYGERWRKKNEIIWEPDESDQELPLLISGTLKYFRDDGRVHDIEIFEDGHPIKYEAYYWNKDSTHYWCELFDWKKTYEDIPGTFWYESYNQGKLALKGWYRRGKKGWRVYPIE